MAMMVVVLRQRSSTETAWVGLGLGQTAWVEDCLGRRMIEQSPTAWVEDCLGRKMIEQKALKANIHSSCKKLKLR
jgi:hypothetical protein